MNCAALKHFAIKFFSFYGIIGILIFLLLALSCGSEAEADALEKTITIDLPNLPDDAKALEMVLIPAGTFTMGSPEDECGRSNREWPPHTVTISKPFYMGKYEFTQGQWEAVTEQNPFQKRKHIAIGPDFPATKLSWSQCSSFIKKLNKKDLGTFRLPTEAEWEYACRAGTDTSFFFGDSADNADDYMWSRRNTDSDLAMEVGQKEPNAWGLYDMLGNVAEWCSDQWQEPCERGAQIDPKGPLSMLSLPLTSRVFRGGSTMNPPDKNRSASRGFEQQIDFHYSLGFRVVMECTE